MIFIIKALRHNIHTCYILQDGIEVYCVFCNTGKHPEVPPFPFESIKKKFRFLSLTTSSEAISVLEHVRVECSKVCAMSLFHTGVSKHLRLEEFDQAQHQASMQVRVKRIIWLIF